MERVILGRNCDLVESELLEIVQNTQLPVRVIDVDDRIVGVITGLKVREGEIVAQIRFFSDKTNPSCVGCELFGIDGQSPFIRALVVWWGASEIVCLDSLNRAEGRGD